jgi:tetratricopeptide (TPR) repeat protein
MVVAGTPAWADDAADCRSPGPAQLPACTRLLADSGLTGSARVGVLLDHAEAVRRTGDKEVSLADLREAEALAPNDPGVLIHLAKYFYDERDLKTSEGYIARAHAVAPNDPVPLNVWGKIFMLRDNYPAAIDKFRAAIALQPTHANAHWNLANALYKTGNLEAALAEYQVCETLYPQGRQKTNASMMVVQVRQQLAAKP